MKKAALLNATTGLCALVAACSQPSTNANLAAVARSGKYSDLTETPDLSSYATKSGLAPVAVSGDYKDLFNAPDLSVYAPVAGLAPVAFSGAYEDLEGAPDLSPLATKESLAAYATAASLSPVATSGNYADLTGKLWSGDAAQISTNAAVSINTTGTAPLSVVAHDTSLALFADQMSTYNGVTYNASTSNWQSFTAGATGTLVRIDVNRWWDGPGTDYTLNVYQGQGTDGQLIHSESGLSIADGFHPIQLGTPVPVTLGQVYTWELTNPTGFVLVGYNWSDYTGGRGSGDSSPDMDFQFTTYVKPSVARPVNSLTVDPKGKVGIGTTAPKTALDVAGALRLRTPSSPAMTDPCERGQLAWDTNYVYVCVSTNVWRRAALASY